VKHTCIKKDYEIYLQLFMCIYFLHSALSNRMDGWHLLNVAFCFCGLTKILV